MNKNKLVDECLKKGLRMTGQRTIILGVVAESSDHPDVEEIYNRASRIDPKIGIATVYRTVRLMESIGVLEKHDFGGTKIRYEKTPDNHHDHLIDIKNHKVIEFNNEEIERLQKKVAEDYGYELVGHRLELYGVKKGKK
tara:strand:+ start:72 stop:488 length:417 start_codon:yes stop_codon:yes gene_type:complete